MDEEEGNPLTETARTLAGSKAPGRTCHGAGRGGRARGTPLAAQRSPAVGNRPTTGLLRIERLEPYLRSIIFFVAVKPCCCMR